MTVEITILLLLTGWSFLGGRELLLRYRLVSITLTVYFRECRGERGKRRLTILTVTWTEAEGCCSWKNEWEIVVNLAYKLHMSAVFLPQEGRAPGSLIPRRCVGTRLGTIYYGNWMFLNAVITLSYTHPSSRD